MCAKRRNERERERERDRERDRGTERERQIQRQTPKQSNFRHVKLRYIMNEERREGNQHRDKDAVRCAGLLPLI